MQNLKRSFHILLNSKLVWVFSILLILSSFLFSSFPSIIQVLHYPIWVIGLFLIFIFATVIIYAVTNGSLIYVIYQASLSKTLSFSEAWSKGKLRLFRILGVLFLWLAIPLLAGLCSMLIRSSITTREITIPLLLILDLVDCQAWIDG